MRLTKILKGLALSLAVVIGVSALNLDAQAFNTVDTAMVSASSSSCVIVGDNVVYTADFNKAVSSDDGKIYLYELKTYEYGIADGLSPIASVSTAPHVQITFPLNYTEGVSRLYNKFVLAVKRNGVITLINDAQYITNPEVLAINPKPRKERPAKALQHDNVANISLDGSGIALPIGSQHAVFTITDRNVPVADKSANGPDSHMVKNNPVVAYMLNAADEDGVRGLIADMTAYAMNTDIQDFVIGNEVNERCWNYMAWTDWDMYMNKYIQAFRVCYTAIKSVNPNARVYISLDQVWNKNPQGNDFYEYIDGDEFMSRFNTIMKKNGNIDWDLSIHPYPNPLYYAKFWDLSGLANGAMFKSQVDNNQVITFQNLSVITNLLTQPSYFNKEGMVRDIIIGEIGLGSNAGVENQAAAICASWAAFEMNPYITQYMYLEVDVNGFFPTMYGKARECYDAMGTPDEGIYMDWALKHIGINNWSQVIR